MSSIGTGLKGVVLDETRISPDRWRCRASSCTAATTSTTWPSTRHVRGGRRTCCSTAPCRRATQLARFDRELKAGRAIPQPVIEIIERVKAAHPMDVLRTAVSAVVALDENSHEAKVEVALPVGIRLISQVATIVAAMHRIRNGLDPVAPRDDLSHAANFLYMMFGQGAGAGAREDHRPGPGAARRAQLERIDVRRARRGRDRRRHRLVHRGRDRDAEGAAARRRRRGGAEDRRGDRRPAARDRVHRGARSRPARR